MDLSTFETNIKAAEEGVWCDIDDEAKIKIARSGNKKFNRILLAKMAPYQRLIDQKRLPEEKARMIMTESIVEGILLDWKGISYEGKEIKYSKANALKILSDERLEDFRNFIVSLSEDVELFRTEKIEETVEKSQAI